MDCKQEQIRDHIERMDELISAIESLADDIHRTLYGSLPKKNCGENPKSDGLMGALRDMDNRLVCVTESLKEIVNGL